MRQEVHLVPPLFFALLLSGCASTGPSNLEGATTIEPVECIRPSHISGSQPPPRPIDPALWGPLADLAGLNWLWFFDKNAEINRFDVIDNGNSIRYAWRSSTLDGCMRVVVFHEPESPGVWRADINDWGAKKLKATYRLTKTNTLLSDEHVISGVAREEVGFSSAGYFIHRTTTESGANPGFPLPHDALKYMPFSDRQLAELEPLFAAGKAEIEVKARALGEEFTAQYWRERKAKRQAFWNDFATGLQVVAQAAAEVAPQYHQQKLESQARNADLQKPARTGPATPSSEAGSSASAPALPAATKPLRIVLMISMRNLPGDANNPSCYSSIITRPGPPGWGTGDSSQSYHDVVLRLQESYKARFIAKCRAASGREPTSEGNYSFHTNRSDEDLPQARVREDVTVTMP